mgnify:CR=1 FL=1
MKSIRSILHILLGVTLICSCNEATELAHITPNVSLIKYKDIVKIDSLYTCLLYTSPSPRDCS